MLLVPRPLLVFFFFNDTATTEIYTLSLHDALPISTRRASTRPGSRRCRGSRRWRSEEHTSELQSRRDLVCRLLLEKKKKSRYVHYDCYSKTPAAQKKLATDEQ